MSAQTKDALEAAIREHIADEYPDNLVGGYVVILERIPPEDDGYSHIVDIVPEGQSNAMTLGLAYFTASARTAHHVV